MNLIVKLPEAPVYHNEITGEDTLEPGYVQIGDGYYDVLDGVEVKQEDVLSSGEDRYESLPLEDRDHILESLVTRDNEEHPRRVKNSDVLPSDIVIEKDLVPHRWFGESEKNPTSEPK